MAAADLRHHLDSVALVAAECLACRGVDVALLAGNPELQAIALDLLHEQNLAPELALQVVGAWVAVGAEVREEGLI